MQAEEIYKFKNGFTVRPCINKYSSLWFCCECGANVISIDPPKAGKFSHRDNCKWAVWGKICQQIMEYTFYKQIMQTALDLNIV